MARHLQQDASAVIEGFLTQYPASTRGVYGQALREAQGFLGGPLTLATHADLVRYQQSIDSQSPATISRKVATLGSFFRYLVTIGERKDDPTAGMRRPRVDPLRSVRFLTDNEQTALLDSASGHPLDLAVAWTALHGLRLSEITGLDVEQYAEGVLWNVVGKGSKVRTIPLAPDARNALEAYLGKRKSGPMFLSRRRDRISRRTVQEMIYRLSERTGKRVSVHALRHTYGTRATRRGINSITLSKLMGHESTTTTERYAHLNTSDLQEANERVYPTRDGAPIRVIDGGRADAR